MRRNETKRYLMELGIPGSCLRGGRWDLSGVELSGKDLRGAHLSKVLFRGANLRGTKLQGANLTLACFREADLTGANLAGADMTETDFEGSIRDDTPWPDTFVDNEPLPVPTLLREELREQKQKGVSSDPIRPLVYKPPSVKMDPEFEETLRFMEEMEAQVGTVPSMPPAPHHNSPIGEKDCRMPRREVLSREATKKLLGELLNQSPDSFNGVHWNCRGVDLSGQDLSGANLRDADFSDANLEAASLVGANISKARFVRANLVGCNMDRAKATGAIFDGAILDSSGEVFRPSRVVAAGQSDEYTRRGRLKEKSDNRANVFVSTAGNDPEFDEMNRFWDQMEAEIAAARAKQGSRE